MENRKNTMIHLIALGMLCFEFVLCRYVFFEIHGMKQWPEILAVVGMLSLGVSFLAKAKIVPVILSFAYIVGFAAGVIFQEDGVDAGGGGTNNLWIIWTLVFVCLIVMGAISELVRKKTAA